jgi:rhomboid protease GluP
MTAVSGLIEAAMYVVLLSAGFRCGLVLLQQRAPEGRRFPTATVAALVVVGVPTLLQLTVAPELLGNLERDRTAIRDGEIWRLVTSLVVQDGGLPGALFNLALLAVMGTIAEQVWGPARWLIVALTAGLGAELWGLAVQPVGAGNSVVIFGLAASLAVLALRRRAAGASVPATIVLLISGVLIVLGDIHGGAALLGAALGVVLARDEEPVRFPAAGQ